MSDRRPELVRLDSVDESIVPASDIIAIDWPDGDGWTLTRIEGDVAYFTRVTDREGHIASHREYTTRPVKARLTGINVVREP